MMLFRRPLPALMCGVFFVSLAACGGGGGSSSGPPAIATTPTTVSVDQSLPTMTALEITQVLSPYGSAALGASVPISTGGSTGESMVYALSASGDILLAATTSSATRR